MKQTIADIVRAADGDETDPDRLLERVGARLPRTLAVDGWCALTLDPESLVKTGGAHGADLPKEVLSRAIELEYAPSEVNRFSELAGQPSPVAVLDEATEGDPTTSRRFRELMLPAGYRHELRLVLRERGRTWGGFTLLRKARTGPFLAAERRLLAALMLDAYGLSARERQVTESVLRGCSTGQIATRLHLSRFTIQDHLRAVFAKTGLPNRHALLAELLFRRSGL